jgi:hypothetical protein
VQETLFYKRQLKGEGKHMKLYRVNYYTEDQDDEHRIWFKRKADAKKYFNTVWRLLDEGDLAGNGIGPQMEAFDFPCDKDGVLELLNFDQETSYPVPETGQEERRVEASIVYQSDIRIY